MTTIYIGPYLVIPPSPQEKQQRQRSCESKCAAPNVGYSAKFCANCGGKVVETAVPVKVTEPLNIRSLADKWTDFMHCPEYGQNHRKGDIWLPNRRGSPGLTLSRGCEDVFTPVELASMHPAILQAEAEKQYGDFVDALKADFGIEPFWEVGIVAYTN